MSQIQEVKNYVYDTMGIQLDFEPWTRSGSFPMYLSSNFDFYSVKTDFGIILGAQTKGSFSFTDLFNANQTLAGYDQWQFNVIFILPKTSQYIVKRLIQDKIPFIIPGKQIFVPVLGMIYFQKTQNKYLSTNNTPITISSELAPSALSVYLFHIRNGFALKQAVVTSRLGISRMTLHRAYMELLSEGLMIRDADLKDYRLPKSWKSEFRTMCRKFKNPVRRKVYLDGSQAFILNNRGFYKTSESALAEFTEMAEPLNKFYAIYYQDWNMIKDKLLTTKTRENDSIIVEIWSIPVPHENETILPIALYLTMNSERDERIKMVIEPMLEKELNRYD